MQTIQYAANWVKDRFVLALLPILFISYIVPYLAMKKSLGMGVELTSDLRLVLIGLTAFILIGLTAVTLFLVLLLSNLRVRPSA